MRAILLLCLIILSPMTFAQIKGVDKYGATDSLDADYSTQLFFLNEVPSDNVSIQERNENTGLLLKDFDTSKDQHRYGIQLQLNSHLNALTEIMGYEFSYGNKMDVGGWVEFLVSKISASFSQIATAHSGLASPSDTLDDTTEDLMQLGLGLGYRTTLIQEFIDSRYFFETINVYATYNSLDENFTGQSYSGPGLRADYGIHRRVSKGTHYGIKLSYNLANVKRSALTDGESGKDRSLVLSWLGLSFDIALYF